jgi:hypothetical protein
MNIVCPVCKNKKEAAFGKYECSACKSKFVYTEYGIRLIKRNKFDRYTFFKSLFVPGVIIGLPFIVKSDPTRLADDFLIIGLFLLSYPILILFRELIPSDNVTLIVLYYRFLSKKLHYEDNGRICAFIITFAFNILGLILVFFHFIK